MKFTLKVAEKENPSRVWDEDYNRPEIKTITDAKVWGEATIGNFNATLRPGEKPRVLVDAIEQDNDTVVPHEWQKTNLVTIIKGRQNYDTVICLRCNITGKRHGLGFGGVERDKKYKHPKYNSCEPETV